MDLYQRKELTKKILLALGTGTILLSALIAPNAPKALAEILKIEDGEDRRRFQQALKRLQKRRLVSIRDLPNGEVEIDLTPQGKKMVLRYRMQDMKIPIPKRWDKKWRLVIFDIPHKRRQASNALRACLRRLGFYQLQKSVFVHPFPCQKEIEFLRQFFEISLNVHILTVSAMDKDIEEMLKAHFDL